MKHLLLILLTLFSLAGHAATELPPTTVVVPEPEDLNVREQELFERGKAQIKAGDFEDAIASFKRLLRFDPKLVEVWYQLGIAYASSGQYADAANAYRLTLERNPDCGPCHCALSLALRETHHAPESLAEAKNCLRLIPNYAGAWNLIGNAEMDLRENALAIKAYRKAVELKPGYVNARFNLGLILELTGHYTEAETQLSKVVNLQPRMVDGWVALGNVRMKLHKNRDAQWTYKRALQISPKNSEAQKGNARAAKAIVLESRETR